MTDLTEDEIREAVRLAEGWEYSGEWLYTPFDRCLIQKGEPFVLCRPELDALAMQLARQARNKWPSTWWEDDGKPWPTNVRDAWLAVSAVGHLLGDGDSAGAIRAILESGVLK